MKHLSILISLYLLFSIEGNSQTEQFPDYEPTVHKGSTVVEQVYSPGLEGNLLGDPSIQPVKIYLERSNLRQLASPRQDPSDGEERE